jgi:hypothetical protein
MWVLQAAQRLITSPRENKAGRFEIALRPFFDFFALLLRFHDYIFEPG